MGEWMGFIDGYEAPKRCMNCNDRDVVQKTLQEDWLCKRCWEKWMGEPMAVTSIEEKCEECGRDGKTPRYFLRNGGHRTCCSACFRKEFGEMGVMVEEIENVRGEVELIPHNPHKVGVVKA